jgi:hypothetical protein
MVPEATPEKTSLVPLTIAKMTPLTNRRVANRRVVNSAAALRDKAIRTYAVEVMDVSRGGCRIRGNVQLGKGAQILLKFQGIALKRAQTIWREENEIGLVFSEPLSAVEMKTIAGPEIFCRQRLQELKSGVREG